MSEKSRCTRSVEERMLAIYQYVSLVQHVHGTHHPESHEGHAVFDAIQTR